MAESTEFTDFVASLPAEYETALMADNVSTAFFRARRAGWTPEQLSNDAFAALKRGGVGLVVTRLGALAAASPVQRRDPVRPKRAQAAPLPECSACGIPYPRGTSVAPGTLCKCGDPLTLTVHETRWSRG
jgi:hypothetical protein